MDRKKIMALAWELALPEPVLGPLERAAERLPSDLPIEALAAPDTAAAAWTAASARLPGWREDGGMAQLAAALAAACRTRMLCREAGVPEEVFSGTMGCFARFLKETRELTGLWAFDRGFWTWRQTGGLLFRLGTLEFEYRRLEEGEQPPPGLNAGDGILSVHIPSDALLTREELDRSYDWAARFFTGEGGRFCPGGKPRAVLCGSWLLAPALEELLPEGSGIRRFAGDYERYAVREDDQEFYRWLFNCESPLPLPALPERTGLQRRAKTWLVSGGKIGMAKGVLRSFSFQ